MSLLNVMIPNDTDTISRTPYLLVGRRKWKRYTSPSPGCRHLFFHAGLRLLMKVDTYGMQSHDEAWLWPRLDEQDRRHFAPILGIGRVLGGWKPTWHGARPDSFVISPLLKLDENRNNRTNEHHQKAKELKEKYSIGDFNAGQWKLYRGRTLIHDYGFSDQYECQRSPLRHL